MDVYSHLFEKRDRGWVNRLDEPKEILSSDGNSATPPQPEEYRSEPQPSKLLKRLARPAGIEPATLGLEGRCSIQLSYGRTEWKCLFVLGKLHSPFGHVKSVLPLLWL